MDPKNTAAKQNKKTHNYGRKGQNTATSSSNAKKTTSVSSSHQTKRFFSKQDRN